MTTAFKSVLCLFTFVATAAAQEAPTPLKPPDPAQRQSVPGGATVPPGQFEACVGIMDMKRRDACIERQTSKGNPAVPGPKTGEDTQPSPRPKADPLK